MFTDLPQIQNSTAVLSYKSIYLFFCGKQDYAKNAFNWA